MANSKLPNWNEAFEYEYENPTNKIHEHILDQISDLMMDDCDTSVDFLAPISFVDERTIRDCRILKLYEHCDWFKIYAVDSPWFTDLVKAVLIKKDLIVGHENDKRLMFIESGFDETYWQGEHRQPIPEIWE